MWAKLNKGIQMTFKSTLALVLLLVGTQSFAATYHCSLESIVGKDGKHSDLVIETSKSAVTVSNIDQKFYKVSTSNDSEVTVFSGWTDSKYVTILLPTYTLETLTNDLFKMELAQQAMPDETAFDSATYLCTKKYF